MAIHHDGHFGSEYDTALERTGLAVSLASAWGWGVLFRRTSATAGVVATLSSSGGSREMILSLSSSGGLTMWGTNVTLPTTTFPLNTWCWIVVTGTGTTSINVYYGAVGSAKNSTSGTIDSPGTFTVDKISVGRNGVNEAEPWIGDTNGMYLWTSTPSGSDVDTQWGQHAGVQRGTLWGEWLRETVATVDDDTSGNARDLTAQGGTFTLTDGPFDASSPIGTVAVTSPLPTVAAAGTTVVQGAVSVTGPLSTVVAAGGSSPIGTVSVTSPLPTLAAAGTTVVTGVASVTGPLSTLVAAGRPVESGSEDVGGFVLEQAGRSRVAARVGRHHQVGLHGSRHSAAIQET